jgi:hypothetical protein
MGRQITFKEDDPPAAISRLYTSALVVKQKSYSMIYVQ